MPYNPLREVTLGCKFFKGQYPKAKCDAFPKGLYFHGGRLSMQEKSYKQLMEVYEFRRHYDKGEIYILKAGQVIPLPNAPKVVSGGSTAHGSASEAAGGVDIANATNVDEQHEVAAGVTIEFDPELKTE